MLRLFVFGVCRKDETWSSPKIQKAAERRFLFVSGGEKKKKKEILWWNTLETDDGEREEIDIFKKKLCVVCGSHPSLRLTRKGN